VTPTALTVPYAVSARAATMARSSHQRHLGARSQRILQMQIMTRMSMNADVYVTTPVASGDEPSASVALRTRGRRRLRPDRARRPGAPASSSVSPCQAKSLAHDRLAIDVRRKLSTTSSRGTPGRLRSALVRATGVGVLRKDRSTTGRLPRPVAHPSRRLPSGLRHQGRRALGARAAGRPSQRRLSKPVNCELRNPGSY